MLTELLSLLEGSANGLSLQEISRALNAQPSAILSMLDMLVRKDRLIEVGPDGRYCSVCGLEAECNLLAVHGKRYVVSAGAFDRD